MQELQFSATSTLALFDTTKSERSEFIRQIVEQIESGDAEALKVLLQIRSMESIIDGLTSRDPKKNKDNVELAKRFHTCIMEEADKHGKQFELHNAKLSVGEVGTTYNYDGCNDETYLTLLSEFETAKAKLDERKKFLQNLPDAGMEYLNRETGELERMFKPIKTSTTSLKVTLR